MDTRSAFDRRRDAFAPLGSPGVPHGPIAVGDLMPLVLARVVAAMSVRQPQPEQAMPVQAVPR